MAAYIYTPSGSSQQSAAMGTEKVRISTTSSAIAVAVGTNPTANLTATCENSRYKNQHPNDQDREAKMQGHELRQLTPAHPMQRQAQ